MPDDTPDIHIDDDWKKEARTEKEKLQVQQDQADDSGQARELPPADFRGLMGLLASQAIMGLGAVQDPEGRGVVIDLDGARFAIDLLATIEEKTRGNLTDEEEKEIVTLLSELRSRWVEISELVAKQKAGGEVAPGTNQPGSSGIITP